jgi:hypothetical protein
MSGLIIFGRRIDDPSSTTRAGTTSRSLIANVAAVIDLITVKRFHCSVAVDRITIEHDPSLLVVIVRSGVVDGVR